MKTSHKSKKRCFDYRPILFLIIIYLLILLPSMVKIFRIQEIYYDKEVRSAVVDGMFFIRDQTGYALADLRVVDVEKEDDKLKVQYLYHYMGNIDRGEYSDVDERIFIEYDLETKNKTIVNVEK
jgi:hypothetical protein